MLVTGNSSILPFYGYSHKNLTKGRFIESPESPKIFKTDDTFPSTLLLFVLIDDDNMTTACVKLQLVPSG